MDDYDCRNCRDTSVGGCPECWPAPDMRALLDEEIADVLRACEESIEEGYALALYRNENNFGAIGKWEVYFHGKPYNNTSAAFVPIDSAILFPTRKAAAAFAATRPGDGPYRVVHVRRYPRPAPTVFGHTPLNVLDALAEASLSSAVDG